MQPYYQPSPAVPSPFSINSAYNDPSFPSGLTSAWAAYVTSSSNIIVFGAYLPLLPSTPPLRPGVLAGAGLYSFFQNFVENCTGGNTCQTQVFSVDTASSISIYGLATVGVQYMLTVGGQPVVPASANADGFQATMSAWTQ